MRRAHRRLHLILWLALAPATLAGLALAVSSRPPEPLAAEAPDLILEEAP